MDPATHVRVRVTDQGIRFEIGGAVLAPSIEQARRMADNIAADPDAYGLGNFPEHAKNIVDSLRKAADIYQAYCLGVYKPGESDGNPS